MIDGLTKLQIEQLRALIRDEIAAEHCEAFGEPPLDARQRKACGNQPRGLTDRDCAIRGGVKAVVTHNGAPSPGAV